MEDNVLHDIEDRTNRVDVSECEGVKSHSMKKKQSIGEKRSQMLIDLSVAALQSDTSWREFDHWGSLVKSMLVYLIMPPIALSCIYLLPACSPLEPLEGLPYTSEELAECNSPASFKRYTRHLLCIL